MRRTGVIVATLLSAILVPSIGGATDTELPVVFFGTQDGPAADLFVEAGDGMEPIVVSAGHDCGPAISASGQLVFASTRAVQTYPGPTSFDLYLKETRGSEPLRLTATPDELELFPMWSPDEEWIVFFRGDVHEGPLSIWKMRPDPSNPDAQQLTFPAPGQNHVMPAWSPDGTLISYTVGSGPLGVLDPSVWIMNADGTDQRSLIEDATDATWHPDGTTIAFSNTAGRATYLSNIGAISFDPETGTVDASSRRIVVGDLAALYQPTYAADGSLGYVRDPDGGLGVPLALPDGTTRDMWVGGPERADVWVLGEDAPRTAGGAGYGHPAFAPFAGWWGS